MAREKVEHNPIEVCLSNFFQELKKMTLKFDFKFFCIIDHDDELVKRANNLAMHLETIFDSKKNFDEADQAAIETFKPQILTDWQLHLQSRSFLATHTMQGRVIDALAFLKFCYEFTQEDKTASIKNVFNDLNKTDDNVTVLIRLLLCLYAELENIKPAKNRDEYRKAIEKTCHSLVYSIQIEDIQKLKNRVGALEEKSQAVDKLAHAFKAMKTMIGRRDILEICDSPKNEGTPVANTI